MKTGATLAASALLAGLSSYAVASGYIPDPSSNEDDWVDARILSADGSRVAFDTKDVDRKGSLVGYWISFLSKDKMTFLKVSTNCSTNQSIIVKVIIYPKGEKRLEREFPDGKVFAPFHATSPMNMSNAFFCARKNTEVNDGQAIIPDETDYE